VYSVPCRWAGLDLIACIGATTITIVGRAGTRIVHPRKRFGQRSLPALLAKLARKPHAVRQLLPELLRDLGRRFRPSGITVHAAHAPRDAARLFAKVLGLPDTQGFAGVARVLRARHGKRATPTGHTKTTCTRC